MLVLEIEETSEGLLTGFYWCCKNRRVPDRVACGEWIEVGLEDEVVTVAADRERAERIIRWFEELCGRGERDDLRLAFASGDRDKYLIILRFLLCVFKYGRDGRDRKSLPETAAYDDLVRRVAYEEERLAGFIRFRAVERLTTASGTAFDLLYGGYRSDSDLLLRLAKYFIRRNGGIPFVLHDMGREKAALFNGESLIEAPLCGGVEMTVGEAEIDIADMFRKYFAAVSISSRANLRLQRQFLPVRYRDTMIEFSPFEGENG